MTGNNTTGGEFENINIDTTAVTTTVTETVIETVSINANNVTNAHQAYTVTAYNADGTEGTLTQVDAYGVQGFGVAGESDNGSGDELGFNSRTGQSEKIVLEIENSVTSVDVSFGWQHVAESAGYTFYLDGVEVGSSAHTGGTDGIDAPRTLSPENGSEFDEIHFYAVGRNSDWVINDITFDVTKPVSPTISLSGDQTITEGSQASYTVSINEAPTEDMTIDVSYTYVSAQTGDIVESATQVTIQAGQTSTQFTLDTVDDVMDESDEVFNVQISNPSNGGFTSVTLGNSSVATILTDNDHSPESMGGTVITCEDSTYTFLTTDFSFSDDDAGDSLQAVRIDTLPADGIIYLDGVAVSSGDEVSVADITAGLLTFEPNLHESGRDEYNSAGTGDQQDDYTAFGYSISDGSNWSSSTATMHIDVSPVADAVSLSVTNTTATLTTINSANILDTDSGFTVKALNLDGTEGSLSQVNAYGVQGFGVAGAASNGSDDEVGYDRATGRSEIIVVEMDNAVTSVDVSFGWQHTGESAGYTFFLDGVQVGSSGHTGGSDGIDPSRTLMPENGSEFDEIHFYAESPNSDWVIHQIEFTQTANINDTLVTVGESASLSISAALIDQDGSESITSLSVTDIPVGMTLTDGINAFTATPGNQLVDVYSWDYENLELGVPAEHETLNPNYILNIVAGSQESLAGSVNPADPNCELTNTTTVSHPVTVVGATLLDLTTVILTATPQITEDDTSITYTATLDNPADGDATITLDNGVKITIEDGATTGSANHSISADSDVYAEADSTVTVSISGTSGGNFTNLDTTSTASTSIVDSIDTTTVSLTTTNVDEDNGLVSFSAILSNPGQTDVVVRTDQGDIVILAGSTSGSLTLDMTDPDVYNDANSVTATVSSVSGGNFEAINFTGATATAQVADTLDTTTVTLTATSQITEDDTSITYTATLDNPADGAMTVTLNNGVEISIADGATSGSADHTVTADSDVYTEADTTVTASITGTTGGNFEDLDTSSTVSTTIVDSIDTTSVILSAASQITEDDTSITYTATLDNPADGAMTVTLDNGLEISIADGETSGTVDRTVTADSDVYSEADTTISAAISGTTGGNFEALDSSSSVSTTMVDSIDTVTIDLAQDSSVNEGATVQYNITVDHAPAVDMTVDVTYSYVTANSGDIVTNTTQITLPANSTTPVTFNVATEDDDFVEGDEVYNVTISNPTDGGFESVVIGNASVETIILNDDYAPESNGGAVVTSEDTTYTFTSADFNYTDANGDPIHSVRIDSLPADGTLYLDSVAVSTESIIVIADIDAGLLTFQPDLNESGREEYNNTGEGDQQDDYASFTFSLSDGTNWSTTPATMSVDISPVADAATVEAAHVTYTPTTIDVSNVNDTDSGYRVTAYDLMGNVATISQISGTNHDGFGVLGETAHGASTELGRWRGRSESLKIEFDEAVSEIDTKFAWQTATEEAAYDFYLDGVKVGSGRHLGSSDEVDTSVNLQPANGAEFDEIVFYAPDYNDDWLINEISFNRAEIGPVSESIEIDEGGTVNLSVSAALLDTDGSESIAQLLVTDVPVGMTLTDGVNSFTATDGNQSVDVLNWNQHGLQLEATNDYYNEDSLYTLNFVAVTQENLDGQFTPEDPTNDATTKETSVPITLVVTDVIDTTSLTLTANEKVQPEGVITYTATLDNPAETVMSILLDNGETIAIDAGNTSGSVDHTIGVESDGAVISETLNANNISGGNFEHLAVSGVATTTTVDASQPSVTITDNHSGTTNGDVTYTFTFSEAVINFTIDDITVTGGTKGAFSSIDASTYQLVVTPNSNSTADITVDIAHNIATDLVGNNNTAAIQNVQAVDTALPTVTITDDTAGTATGEVTYTFTFSEDVTGFEASDISVANGTKGVLTKIDAQTYTMVITPDQNSANPITVDIASGVVQDAVGNRSEVASQNSQPVDTAVPTATLSNASSLDYPQIKLDTEGVTLGDSAPQITALNSSGDFAVTWEGLDGNGTTGSSIYVQTFNANGTTASNMVKLEAEGVTDGVDVYPQITALNRQGDFAVTWQGDDGNDSSIYVQTFNANGTTASNMVKLEAEGVTNRHDSYPQITALNSQGDFAVTWSGQDAGGDYSIYVQTFNANGTAANSMVKLEAEGVTDRGDYSPQITTLNSQGDFAVTWQGWDGNDYSIYVQTFNADGTTANSMVKLEAEGVTNGYDSSPQITTLNSSGDYAVTWRGYDGNDDSIYVQTFNANSTTASNMVKLEAEGETGGRDYFPQITALNSQGDFAVTWQSYDGNGYGNYVQTFSADGTTASNMFKLEAEGVASLTFSYPQITALNSQGDFAVTWSGFYGNDYSIYVQTFKADGTTASNMVELEADGVTNGQDWEPQITALNSQGDFAVTWSGQDTDRGQSIFVQQFNADGTVQASTPDYTNSSGSVEVQSSEIGTAYLVAENSLVTSVAEIEALADDQWNSVAITTPNTDTALPALGLAEGHYKLYTADAAGNLSSAANGQVVINNTPPTITDVSLANADAKVGDALVVTLTASATGLSLISGTINGVAVTGFTDHGDNTYSAIYTVQEGDSDMGAGSDIAVNFVLADAAGNSSSAYTTAISQNSLVIDANSPTVTITDDTAGTATGEVTYTFTFSEAVTGFSVDDIAVTGGTKGSFNAVDATTYTLVVTPNANSTTDIHVEVAANTVTDLAGNPNTTAVQHLQTVDTTDITPPTATLSNASSLDYPQIKLEAEGLTHGNDWSPQITPLNSSGDYAVTWTSLDGNDYSIYVQTFNADGTTASNMVKLEAEGVTNGDDHLPQITALNSQGDFAVTWKGYDGNDSSIYVQTFNADGTTASNMVKLDAEGVTDGWDSSPQITALNSQGDFAVTWQGYDGNDSSIYVQTFYADGSTANSMVKLEAEGVTDGNDWNPQITALNSQGDFAVTWSGDDTEGDDSIYVQTFNADGTPPNSMVKLEPEGVTDGWDFSPKITALNSQGDFAVTWEAWDGVSHTSDKNVYVQTFNADGTTASNMVKLEAEGVTDGEDRDPQITALNSSGDFAVTWSGWDGNDYSIYVQTFNADGTPANSMVKLEAEGVTDGWDYSPQITALNSQGDFAVTWYGYEGGDSSIYVQTFNADGTPASNMVKLEPEGVTNRWDYSPQISALNNQGDFAVIWYDYAGVGDQSIFVQQFNADGTVQASTPDYTNSSGSVEVQSSEIGTAYLVAENSLVTSVAEIEALADDQWNSVAITTPDTDTALPALGLAEGHYKLYTADAAGNLSTAADGSVVVDYAYQSILYGDDNEADIFTVVAEESVETVDFDPAEDVLNLSDIFDEYGLTVDDNTLGDYLEFAMADSDGDNAIDDTLITVDSNGTHTAGGETTQIYFRDEQFDEISDLNIDYD